MSAVTRVLIVDDHSVVRDAMATYLSLQSGMKVSGTAGSAEEALAHCRIDPPDVVLLDVRMPGMDGLELLRELRARYPAVRVVMLSSQEGDQAIASALKAGAVGYLLKSQPMPTVVDAIRSAHLNGRVAMAPEIAQRLADRLHATDLSAREVQVLRQIARGASNHEIGAALDISTNTVKRHIASLLGKLGAADRTHAVTLALQRGIIDLL